MLQNFHLIFISPNSLTWKLAALCSWEGSNIPATSSRLLIPSLIFWLCFLLFLLISSPVVKIPSACMKGSRRTALFPASCSQLLLRSALGATMGPSQEILLLLCCQTQAQLWSSVLCAKSLFPDQIGVGFGILQFENIYILKKSTMVSSQPPSFSNLLYCVLSSFFRNTRGSSIFSCLSKWSQIPQEARVSSKDNQCRSWVLHINTYLRNVA